MKRVFAVILLCLCLSLGGCGSFAEPPSSSSAVSVTDALGNTVFLGKDARVVSCYGSFADIWLLSGGTLAGVTQDAVDEGIVSAEVVTVVGSVKNINLEKIAGLSPDYVILSADLAAHRKLQDSLNALNIPYGYFRVDTFSDYKAVMTQFCAVNDRQDLFDQNVLQTEARILSLLEKLPSSSSRSVLLVRVYSTGMKAKSDDNLAGKILKEFGLRNIADDNPSLLEDLSVEQILLADPDYVIALSMGDEDAAKEFLKQNLENNPAWQGLSAVKNQRYALLPKDLFHYKPNERWDESYEYLAKIVYPENFG